MRTITVKTTRSFAATRDSIVKKHFVTTWIKVEAFIPFLEVNPKVEAFVVVTFNLHLHNLVQVLYLTDFQIKYQDNLVKEDSYLQQEHYVLLSWIFQHLSHIYHRIIWNSYSLLEV